MQAAGLYSAVAAIDFVFGSKRAHRTLRDTPTKTTQIVIRSDSSLLVKSISNELSTLRGF
jgi:hypothetical protein